MSDQIDCIGVIGAGVMGSGIAQVFAMSGFNVVVCDMNHELCQKSLIKIKKGLSNLLRKSKISNEELSLIVERIEYSIDMSALLKANIVIEAVSENLLLKKKIFSELDALLDKKVIFASNTSSLSITNIASAASRADKVIGMHFMNPVPVMKCVEVIKGTYTSDETFQQVSMLIDKIGKEKIVVKDSPGFIINRILMPMINEAIHVFHSGIANIGDIDLGMKLSCNLPMGPLALADLIGLDTVSSILSVLHHNLKEEKFRPCELLGDYISLGKLGKKVGIGFYEYK